MIELIRIIRIKYQRRIMNEGIQQMNVRIRLNDKQVNNKLYFQLNQLYQNIMSLLKSQIENISNPLTHQISLTII